MSCSSKQLPSVVGYNIKKALSILEGMNVIVSETSTPYEDKKLERIDKEPVVVRQTARENNIELVVCKFL